MWRHFFSLQFLTFLFVGAGAAGLNFLSRIWLSHYFSYPVSLGLAYLIGFVSAFFLNKWLIFPKNKRAISKQFQGFFITNLVAFPLVWLSALLLLWGFQKLHFTFYPKALSHFLALGFPTLISFLSYKFLVFKK